MQDLAQKNILVLGLGVSGLALARWCTHWGAQVTVADTRQAPPQLPALQQALPQVRFVAGALDASLIAPGAVDAVFKSPGLAPDQVQAVVQAAQAAGVPVGGELDLFWQALKTLQQTRGYTPQVVAITGTNGKTTVTSLTGQLVHRAGRTVAMAGNIGPSLLDTLLQHTVQDDLPQVWVLELSSFQLDALAEFEPSVATVLNLSQDHLDWHGSMAAYAAAKARVYGQHGVMLLNRDDAQVMLAMPTSAPAVKGKPSRRVVTFGRGRPQRPGDYGIETINGMAWLVRASVVDETVKRAKNEDVELHMQHLMPVEALRIHGGHNATNALAALALACAIGCSLAPLLHGLRAYQGEPHRLQWVATIRGVDYFDDSKGTNVGATVAALSGLADGAPSAQTATHSARKIVLILGGLAKGQDFAPLAEPVARHARAVVLIGADAPLIREALCDCGVPLLDATTMLEAVTLAAQQATPADAVLLSPACASFDMFDGYAHRGQVFCEAVALLAQDAGVLA